MNPEEKKEAFYNHLKDTLRNIPSTDKLLLIVDFNERIGRKNDKSTSALGKSGIGKCNSNGELPLALCTVFDLIVINPMFKKKDVHKTTWTPPRSRHGHMIQFIITRCRDKWTFVAHEQYMEIEHQMLRSRVIFSVCKHNQKGAMKPVKLNTSNKYTEKHQTRGEPCAVNGLAQSCEYNKTHCFIVSNRLCKLRLKHLLTNMKEL